MAAGLRWQVQRRRAIRLEIHKEPSATGQGLSRLHDAFQALNTPKRGVPHLAWRSSCAAKSPG